MAVSRSRGQESMRKGGGEVLLWEVPGQCRKQRYARSGPLIIGFHLLTWARGYNCSRQPKAW